LQHLRLINYRPNLNINAKCLNSFPHRHSVTYIETSTTIEGYVFFFMWKYIDALISDFLTKKSQNKYLVLKFLEDTANAISLRKKSK